jgi:hypothetical protein
MTAPRDQVVCRQCGATLGRFVSGRQPGGRSAPNQYRFTPRLDLHHNVVVYLTVGHADIFCPECGKGRQIDLNRYSLVVRGKAA